ALAAPGPRPLTPAPVPAALLPPASLLIDGAAEAIAVPGAIEGGGGSLRVTSGGGGVAGSSGVGATRACGAGAVASGAAGATKGCGMSLGWTIGAVGGLGGRS